MRLSTIVASLFTALAVTAASGGAQAETIRFGVASEPYAPFSVQDASGKWVGWEIDLMDAVCAELKAECEIVNVAWDGIIPALQEKKFDVIWSSMSITDERMKVIDFTDKYYFSPNVLVGAKADTRSFDVADPATMQGINVGAQTGTTHARYMEEKFAGVVNLKVYNTLDDEVADLNAGRIDLLMASGIQIQDFLKKPEGAAYEIKVTLPQEQMFGFGDGGGLRKEDTELKGKLNAAIVAVRASGKYDEITAKYFDIDIYGE